MDDLQQQAIEKFRGKYNCAQSVLSVFAEKLGLSKDMAMKLASPFGAGIAYKQETCGAVTGSIMAIGLKYGKGSNGTDEDKEIAYDLANHFITEFKKIHHTLLCRELMQGLDMSTPEGMSKIMELDLFRLHCVNYVKDAVSITEKILNR